MRFPWRASQARTSNDQPDALAILERRLQRTYKARVETARRYQARGNYWNVALVLASLTTAAVSVVSITAPDVYGPRGATLMVVLGIVTLVVSVLVTSAQFQVQAEKFFHAYRSLQKLWVSADMESRKLTHPSDRNAAAARIDLDYQAVLDDTNNHSPADFYTAFPGVIATSTAGKSADPSDAVSRREFYRRKIIVWGSNLFTYLPVIMAVGLLLLLVPAVLWFGGA